MKNREELKKKNVGVFFGGKSPEHEISIITGEFIAAELKKMGYSVVSVYVDRNGVWYSDEQISELKFFKEDYQKKLSSLPQYHLNLSSSKKKLVLQSGGIFGKKSIEIDYVFPAFHGLGGEDGTIQGLAEFFGVPYAGCGIHASSVAIDKAFTKERITALDIPTTDFVVCSKKQWEGNKQSVLDVIQSKLTFPVFVKPARAGSSIGISKVKKQEDLAEALDLGFYYDIKVVVENGVENIIDLTCAVLSDGKEVVASEIQKSLFESDLFDYSVKYLEDGGAQIGNAQSNLVIPADVTEEITKRVKDYSKQIFESIDANGTARVDFLLNGETGELYANEINTLPGTLYHHLWDKSGVNIHEVIGRMIDDGFVRWNMNEEMHVDFKTDVLNNANQMKLQTKEGEN